MAVPAFAAIAFVQEQTERVQTPLQPALELNGTREITPPASSTSTGYIGARSQHATNVTLVVAMGAQIGPRLDTHLYDVPSLDLVQQVTGIRPEASSGHAFLKEAGFKSIQRLVLADANGGVVVGLWPGELMRDAQFLYSEHRAEVFLSAAEAGGWLVRPTPHIGFWQSPARQRLYLDPTIALGQYVELWEGPGWGRFGGYSQEDLARSLWPWLKEQGLATDADDSVLGEFLVLLTSLRRQAHLRAGPYAKREGSREEIAGWPRSHVASEVRAEANRVLQSIGEPKLPASHASLA